MKLELRFLFVMVILLSSWARAEGLRVVADPYLGYGLLGSLNANVNGANTNVGSMHGFGYGIHAQVEFYQPFFLGLDLSYFPSLNFSPNSSVTGSMRGVNPLVRFGPTLGTRWNKYQFYVGYNFINNFSQRLTLNSTSLAGTWNGSSVKLGVGYQALDFLRVHAEYFFENYNSNSASSNMLLLSIHLPFTVFDNLNASTVSVGPSSTRTPASKEEERTSVEVKRSDIQKFVIHFEFGKCNIDSNSIQILEEVSRNLNDLTRVKVRVEGHTDSLGLNILNQKESLFRAESVREFFLGKGIPSRNISVQGFSSFRPVQDNSTSQERAKNRRAEIFVELENNREAAGVKPGVKQ